MDRSMVAIFHICFCTATLVQSTILKLLEIIQQSVSLQAYGGLNFVPDHLNTEGKMIMKINIEDNDFEMDVSHLQQGLYYIKNDQGQTTKFLKLN